jgi:hypothetical protein
VCDLIRTAESVGGWLENWIIGQTDASTRISQHLLTYARTEMTPSWEAANCEATRELPSILWNPEVHYRVHKSPLHVPILSLISTIHTIPSYLSEIHFNIVHPPMSWFSQRSVSFWLLWTADWKLVCTRKAPRPTISTQFFLFPSVFKQLRRWFQSSKLLLRASHADLPA